MIELIPLKQIIPRTGNRGEYPASKETIKELADSITQVGLINPLSVIKHGKNYDLVAGNRRLAALKLLKVSDALCLIVDSDKGDEIQAVENIQRENLHPMDEAIALQKLMTRYPVEDVAARIGKSTKFVYLRVRLCKLIPEIKELFLENKIRVSVAMEIARLTQDQQGWVKENCWLHEGTTTSQIRKQIDEHFFRDLSKAVFDLEDVNIVKKVGSCTDCEYRSTTDALLFDDLLETDTCTNQLCYNNKVLSHMRKLKKKHPEALLISSWHYSQSSHCLNNSQYEICKKSNKKAVRAIWVEGEKKGRTCFVIDLRKAEKVKEMRKKTKEELAEEKAQRKEQDELNPERLDYELRRRITDAFEKEMNNLVLNNAHSKLFKWMIALVLHSFGGYQNQHIVDFLDAKGIDYGENKYPYLDQIRGVLKLAEENIMDLFFEIVLDEVILPNFDTENNDCITEFFESLGIDWKAVFTKEKEKILAEMKKEKPDDSTRTIDDVQSTPGHSDGKETPSIDIF